MIDKKLKRVYKRWAYEECKLIASGYCNLCAWSTHDHTSYRYAYRSGWQRTIAEELGWKIGVGYAGPRRKRR